MGKLNSKQSNYLEEKFGNHVSFRKMERKLYSHDIAAMPSLIKPLIGDTTPDAVVQPETEEDVDHREPAVPKDPQYDFEWDPPKDNEKRIRLLER